MEPRHWRVQFRLVTAQPSAMLNLMWNDVLFYVGVIVLGIAPIILMLLALFWG
jgi:hypothetical protein